MRLSEEDKELLAGVYGDVAREAMEYQVEVGRFYGAEEMVSISQAHAGMDYAMNGAFGLQTVETFASRAAKFRCFTKTSFMVMDLYRWKEFGSPEEVVEKQLRYRAAMLCMGAIPTYSNLPFSMPQFGEDVVWTGGNTTVLANSYFGARTNLEGPLGGLMAALAGRVPRTGLRIPEDRRGNVLVHVDARPEVSSDWDALGFAIGKVLPSSEWIPVLNGLVPIRSMGDRQRFDSNLTTTSSLQMYHIPGATPEAPTLEAAFGDRLPKQEIRVSQADMLQTYRELAVNDGDVDLVAFGGHHVELDEFPRLVAALEGRRVRDGVRLWVFTGPQYKAIIEAMGWDTLIERAGGEMLHGTSLMFMTPGHLASKQGIRNVVTDSAKTATYVRGFGMRAAFRSVEACVEAAISGRMDLPARKEIS